MISLLNGTKKFQKFQSLKNSLTENKIHKCQIKSIINYKNSAFYDVLYDNFCCRM